MGIDLCYHWCWQVLTTMYSDRVDKHVDGVGNARFSPYILGSMSEAKQSLRESCYVTHFGLQEKHCHFCKASMSLTVSTNNIVPMYSWTNTTLFSQKPESEQITIQSVKNAYPMFFCKLCLPFCSLLWWWGKEAVNCFIIKDIWSVGYLNVFLTEKMANSWVVSFPFPDNGGPLWQLNIK